MVDMEYLEEGIILREEPSKKGKYYKYKLDDISLSYNGKRITVPIETDYWINNSTKMQIAAFKRNYTNRFYTLYLNAKLKKIYNDNGKILCIRVGDSGGLYIDYQLQNKSIRTKTIEPDMYVMA